MWSKFVILVFAALVLVSCGSKRRKVKLEKEGTGTSVSLGDYNINNLDFLTFSGRAKAKVEMGTAKHDLTLHVRIQRDKAIWISVTALLGIEAARVLITPDSVRILNKLQGEYIAKPFSYIYRYTNKGIAFSTLQDLLMANVSTALLHTDQMTVARSEDETQIVGIKQGLNFQYSLNQEARPKAMRLNQVGSSENLEALYANFETISGYKFPKNQQIDLNAESIKVSSTLEYVRVIFNDMIDVPFTVPAKYKVID